MDLPESTVVPIETVYRGYRFRSRLEARWAVFFDALQIKFEYEPQGFEWGNGQRYLPDFYLPQSDECGGTFSCGMYAGVFAEVKPFHSAEHWSKAISFGSATGCCVLLLDGPPDLRSYRMHDPDGGDAVAVIFGGERPERMHWKADDKIEYLKPGEHPDLVRAIYAARGARFEFGAPLSRVI